MLNELFLLDEREIRKGLIDDERGKNMTFGTSKEICAQEVDLSDCLMLKDKEYTSSWKKMLLLVIIALYRNDCMPSHTRSDVEQQKRMPPTT